MNEIRQQWLITGLLVCLAVVSFFYPGPSFLGEPSGAVIFLNQLELAAVINKAHPLRQLGERTQLADCMVANGLPDPECTPGGVFPGATAVEICVRGYASSMRSVSDSLKRRIYESYSVAAAIRSAYAIDHLISLQLGGNNEADNLWPLRVAGDEPGYYKRDKDLIENYLHDEVCAGRITLVAAQMQIAQDWRAVYDSLEPKRREALRREYAARWQN